MKKLYVEVADSHSSRAKGLMGRKTLSSNAGMLFKFPFDDKLSFWMANTYIPLDIAFLNRDGKVLQIESMVPLSTRSVMSSKLCCYALEVNKGWFERNGIKEGDFIQGHGISSNRIAQVDTQEAIDPDVRLNMSFREKLEDAHLHGKNLTVIYQTKKGNVLPPKVISPPFVFEKDEDGKSNAIVKAWDNQTAGWKSFIIDNILNLEDAE